MDILALFEKMIVLFVCMMAGFICGKTGVMNSKSNKGISNLIANLTSPMLALSSVMTKERLMTNREALELTLIVFAATVFLIATSYLLPRLLHLEQKESGIYRFMYIFSNTGFIGYPLVRALFGEGAMFHVTIFVCFTLLFCWSYGAQTISGEGKFRFSLEIFKSPNIVAALLAYAIFFSGIRVPAVVGDAVSFIGDVTSPLAMLIIGSALAECSLRSIFGNWKLYALTLIKMILVPVLAYFVLRSFVTNELLLGVTVVALAMPAATNTTIICYQYHADERLAAAGVFLTTLVSVVSVPLLMLVLFG